MSDKNLKKVDVKLKEDKSDDDIFGLKRKVTKKKLTKKDKQKILDKHNKDIRFGEKNKSVIQKLQEREFAKNTDIGIFQALVGFDGPKVFQHRKMTDKWWIIPMAVFI